MTDTPGYVHLRRVAMSLAILGGPVAFDIGGALAPAIHDTAEASIAANLAANPIVNNVHLALFVVASYLLPLGVVGLALLTYRRAPWLATLGGLIGVIGWAPFSALTVLDDATVRMAELPGAGSYAALLDRFTNDPVMLSYLLIYIVGHLVAYVLLGAALLRARLVPRWAGWAIVVSSPLQVLAFALPGSPRLIGGIALTLLVLGSIPAAMRALTGEEPALTGAEAAR
ncbi:MAG: hypothetical protein ACRDT6_22480 [Micromonosporaceae bacterium]